MLDLEHQAYGLRPQMPESAGSSLSGCHGLLHRELVSAAARWGTARCTYHPHVRTGHHGFADLGTMAGSWEVGKVYPRCSGAVLLYGCDAALGMRCCSSYLNHWLLQGTIPH